MDRRAVLYGLSLGFGTILPGPINEAVDRLRRDLDETLEATTVSDSTVDHWHSVADSYGRIYRSSAPLAFLVSIAQDIGELRLLTDQRLPTAQRRGLCHATGRMSGLLATTLVNLNDHRQARAWFQTGLRAAEQSEEPALRAWMLVRHAVSALYWGDPTAALHLSTQASGIARNTLCVAAAWAPAVQARALARLGRTEQARAAVRRAEESFTTLEARHDEQDAYGYTAAQMHFYRGNALTEIGDTAEAYEAQKQALRHYGTEVFLDTSLVRLDQAICLVKDGEPEEAVRRAGRLLMELPAEHRPPIVTDRARRLLMVIPIDQRDLPAVRQYRDILAVGTTE